jgi:hypothetical protein
MEATLIIIGFVAVFGGVLGYSLYSGRKQKNAQWTGTIVDKSVQEMVHDRNNQRQSGVSINGISLGGNNGSNVTHNYSIVVQPDGGGEQFKWPISSGLYEQLNIGDKLSKRPGTKIPEVTEKASAPAPTPAQPATATESTPEPPTQTPPIVPTA